MRIPRKQKKKLRAILLCYTGNIECKGSFSKVNWCRIKKDFKIWYSIVSIGDRINANKVKRVYT